jgi:hypothetical protein
MFPTVLLLFSLLCLSFGSDLYQPNLDQSYFSKLILSLEELLRNVDSVPFDSPTKESDPLKSGEETLISKFYRIMQIYKSLPHSNPQNSYQIQCNKLVSKGYYPAVRKVFKSDTNKFLSSAIKAPIPIQIMIYDLDGLEKDMYDLESLNDCIQLIMGKESEEEMEEKLIMKQYYIGRASRFAEKHIKLLLNQPIVSPEEWKTRSELIAIHIQFGSILSNCWNLSINGQDSMYTFLANNFATINGKIDLQKFQNIYEILAARLGPETVKALDDKLEFLTDENYERLALFNLYSKHFHWSQTDYSAIDLRQLCLTILLEKETLLTEVN